MAAAYLLAGLYETTILSRDSEAIGLGSVFITFVQ